MGKNRFDRADDATSHQFLAHGFQKEKLARLRATSEVDQFYLPKPQELLALGSLASVPKIPRAQD
jgi:hypothetical protein